MKLLTRSQLRFLRRAPVSTVTVLLGVSLAVTSIVAVHQISQRVAESLDALTPAYLRSASYLLEKPGLAMEDYFALRARWRAGELPRLQSLMPVVEGAGVAAGRMVRILGLDAFSGMPGSAGLALLPVGEVVAGAGRGYQVDQRLDLGGRIHRVALVSDALPTDLLVTDLATAQTALGLDDEALSYVAVVVEEEGQALLRWMEALLPGFSAGLTLTPMSLPGWQVRTLDSDLPGRAFGRSVLFNLGALGSLSLVVAWLLVYQVGVIWLRRQQLTLTRLRQMGVSEAELRLGFVGSLVGLGLLAALPGIWLGEVLAEGLVRLVTGYADPGNDPGLDRWALLKGLGSAGLVCLIGGLVACLLESRPEGRSVRPWLIGGGILLAGVWGLLGSESLAGGFLAIAAAAALVLLAIPRLLAGLKLASRHIGGALLTRIGIRELLWYPGDLAVAVGALSLALGTSIAIALMVDSFRVDFETMLDRRLVHDVFVVGGGRDLTELAENLRGRDDVDRVQAYGRVEARVAGLRVEVGYTPFDAGESRRYGLGRALRAGECLISERLARAGGLAVGSEVVLSNLPLVVAGVFAGYGDSTPRLLVNAADAGAAGFELRFDRLSIASGSPDRIIAQVEGWQAGLSVEDQRSLRGQALEIFDRTFAITRALTLVALLVASVGLYNALMALELVRQRARLLLVAMGVADAELARVARWRVLGVGMAALAFALPLGLVMGVLLCRVINPRAFGWSVELVMSWPSFAYPVASAALAMLAVSLLPTPVEAGEAGIEDA